MNDNLPPIFREILTSIQAMPATLQRAAEKAAPRRFTGEPQTGFGALPGADIDREAIRQKMREEFACGFEREHEDPDDFHDDDQPDTED